MEDLLEGLNDAQREAVSHGEGPLLIVAGAGTGKTTVLTRRYAWLLKEKGLKPENILALTFTEKAAGEMEDRVLQLLPNGTYDFWISTFHGFCQRILEEKGLEIGLPNRFKLLTQTDGWLMLKRRLEDLPLNHYRPLGNPQKFLGALLSHVSRAKDENVSPEDYQRFALESVLDGDSEFVDSERKRLQELADLSFFYRKIMRDEGALDFGDLIQETLRLFRERPGVLKELRQRFPYILVDEFQDTNWAQYELVKLLTDGEVVVDGKSVPRPRNVTVVGDDDQAIYKFRGASLANILQFRDDYPDAKTVYLTDNYRSKQEILDLAYNFIVLNNPNRLEVKLQDTGLSKRLTAFRSSGGGVRGLWYPSIEEEAHGVAKQIADLKAEDASLTWNDIAILVRSNDGAEPFVDALDHLSIPFRFYALRGLYAKPIILDLVNALTLLIHQQDSPALWRVLNMPTVDIAAADAAQLTFYADEKKGIGLWQACHDVMAIPGISEAGKKLVTGVVSKIEKLSEDAKRERPLKVLQFVLEQFGLLSYILNLPEREKIEGIDLLNGFANRIKRYEANTAGANLKGFLDELTSEIESGEEGALKANPDDGPELVKILTIHASKGLEFKHVFIVSMVDQRFPTRRRPDPIPLPEGLVKERLTEGDAHLEEERRLFYVAVTRAKDSVTFTGADDYGGSRAKKPSPFLTEAGIAVTNAHRASDTSLLSLRHAERIEGPETNVRELFPLKRRFSYTQLAAFRSCPLQYKFAHLYRIPILGSYQKSFGQSVHMALHDILKLHADRGAMQQESLFGPLLEVGEQGVAGFRVSPEEAEVIYQSRWIDEWYPDRAKHDEYFAEGIKAIRAFVRECQEHPPNPKSLELPFDWRIGQHSIKGAIDRMDELPDGSIAIYDYKTGQAKAEDDLTAEDKEQLRMYQLAMEEKGEKVSRLALVYVRGMVTTDVDVLEGEAKVAFTEKLLDRMNAILTSDYEPSPSSFVCRFCDFKNICEHRKL
ncbi:MAG: ATP-dependent helicase [Candidatus Uhrbacteria bacterium]|nr:ATP-dependent helicase [Candidatus Uhrbacteria bacterium]